jgi:hypothetical protein
MSGVDAWRGSHRGHISQASVLISERGAPSPTHAHGLCSASNQSGAGSMSVGVDHRQFAALRRAPKTAGSDVGAGNLIVTTTLRADRTQIPCLSARRTASRGCRISVTAAAIVC